jgi:hypothetical protein
MKSFLSGMILSCLLIFTSSHAQTVQDAGFEKVRVGAGQFQYRPTGSPWTFTGASGIAANGSGFGAATAPEGTQVGILQRETAVISQTVTFPTTGTYAVTFKAAQRGFNSSSQVIVLTIDGLPGQQVQPVGTSFQTYYAMLPTLEAGNHTFQILGLNPYGGDQTVFIDAVSIGLASTMATTVNTGSVWIGSSGKTVCFRFAGDALPTQVISSPSVYINGVAIPPLGPMADLDANRVALFPLPSGVSVSVGDIVTVRTSSAWMNTSAGLAKPLMDKLVANHAGKSPLPPSELAQRTFVPGVNNNLSPMIGWGQYYPFKNWAYKVNWPPGTMNKIRGVGTLNVYSNNGANGVDNTSYPGPAGLWMVYWKSHAGPNNEPAADFYLTTTEPASTVVTESVDLANPDAPGGYKCRVFDFQHNPTSTNANIAVSVHFNDPSNTGNYDDLWIVGPGDFSAQSNTPTTFDTSDPFDLSNTYRAWLGTNVASMRWVDSSNCGGNPVTTPYPELLSPMTDTGWGDLSGRTVQYGFTSIGPVDPTVTPWMYSPHYKKATEQYTATITQDITTTPSVGTNEIYVFSDADTAPLMTGLTITLGTEDMRIMNVSGQSVRVYRGSNGTTPAKHTAGQVKVSGRRPIGIAASGIMGGSYTYQLTTKGPHGQFTGSNSLNTQGTGWPTITWSDGSTTGRLDTRPPMITGPNTMVSYLGTGKSVKPSQVYNLDPTTCYARMVYGHYIPPEVTAITTAKFPRAALHVNINMDACDDFVWHYMRLIRDNFPAGRHVIVEYMNEPWNWGFAGFEYMQRCGEWLGYENPYQLSYYMRRAGEIGNIARAVFKEKGRASEIKLMLNCQMGSDQAKNHLSYAIKNNWVVDRIGNAPYLQIDVGKAAFSSPYWDDDQLCDLWSIFLWYDKRPLGAGYVVTPWMKVARDAIDAYNKSNGNTNCQLMGYEGGIESAIPSGVANPTTRGLDLTYNPNWYWFEDTFYRWCQREGFVNLHVYSLSQYHSPQLWGMYHWTRQRRGYGDGRFGGNDNRLRLARPGQPNTKPPGMNVDYNDSVRGQAFVDWTSPAASP